MIPNAVEKFETLIPEARKALSGIFANAGIL